MVFFDFDKKQGWEAWSPYVKMGYDTVVKEQSPAEILLDLMVCRGHLYDSS